MENNPFGEFEKDFQTTEKADPAAVPGRVPEETYKFVCTTIDAKGDGVLVDKEIFVTPKGTKGFKLYCEIMEPESVVNAKTKQPEKTKGQVIEWVTWITKDNLPYAKRDVSTILGRDFKPGELLGEVCLNTPWAGRTFEGVVRDDTYKGFTRSRIAFVNPWAPPAPAGPNPHGAATSGTPGGSGGKTPEPDPKKPEPQKGVATPPPPAGGTDQKKSATAAEPVKGAADF